MFVDRVLATLAHLRHDLPHSDLAVLLGVDRSTVSVAIRQVRPLLAARGFAVPDQPGIRLRTIGDVFAYAEAEDVELGIDGTDVQVRRPKAGRPGRKACVSGKCRQNTIKTTTFSDGQARTLFCGVARPGRMHDQTAVRTEGIAQQLRCRPGVKVHVDEGCRGLANQFHHRSPKRDATLDEQHAWRQERRAQSADRICVEHANAEDKQWRPLQRYIGRREDFAETQAAIAGLVSDRSARRAARRETSKELVLAADARPTSC
ncbi:MULTISPECIES: transposase family protein [unclassified Streptomyces]|uniref:transposase family protein n=1 Tax=unclassified Streptomyces TaxID=2593676 RepID=UPI0003690522|nr:transposase family protein [Streptomyces sp. BoleA5]